ncbi:MAG: hypothetical protein JXP34_20325 [Planctomycetes bacterium]|nr:hypothetical protein [Planctomycetota bacterium]
MERRGGDGIAEARVIRAEPEGMAASSYPLRAVEDLAAAMVKKARARAAEIERQADRMEVDLASRRRTLEEEIAAREREARERLEREAAEAARALAEERARVTEEAREAAHREGFSKGYEEGFQAGHTEGAAKGRDDGRVEGAEEATRRIEEDFGTALAACRRLAEELGARMGRLVDEARRDLLHLAVDVARKVVKREVRDVEDTLVANVRKAIDLVGRRHGAVIRIHPDDLAIVERRRPDALGIFREHETFRLEASAEVGRGGCVVESGAGRVDMSIETQLEVIEQALYEASAHAGVRS